jgi:excisionase family DNA binding protein
MKQKKERGVRLVCSVDEAAVRLDISRETAYRAVHEGQIPSVRIGRLLKVPIAALEKLANGE